eukprot:COSAG02_NODE_170_length_31534_cov_33.568498_26_plen_44_part_00
MVDWAGSRKAYAGSYEIEFFTGNTVVRKSGPAQSHTYSVVLSE